MTAQLKHAILFIGLDTSQYAGHSFCIGAATEAAKSGLAENVIQQLGRWHFSAIKRYIRINSFQFYNLPRLLSFHILVITKSFLPLTHIGNSLAYGCPLSNKSYLVIHIWFIFNLPRYLGQQAPAHAITVLGSNFVFRC